MNLFGLFAKKTPSVPTPPYREWVAYITNSSHLQAPTAVVVKNELGVELAFMRNGTGEYLITGLGAFPDYKKVIPHFNPQQGSPIVSNIFWNDANSLGVLIWTTDGILTDNLFVGNLVIRVYN
jgi:hypothetical protein